MNKKLFKGTFNISGQTFEMHTKALTKERAFLNFISQMSKINNLARHYFLSMFDGSKDNYRIEEV